MLERLKGAWDAYVWPWLHGPTRLQVAALCYRRDGKANKILLITSRDTGRWIIPKGWPIDGLNDPEAAKQEAWEEAGVSKGSMSDEAIGHYTYRKSLDDGLDIHVKTMVFPLIVEEISDEFPEADQRERKWVSQGEAANMVDEPELQSILRAL
jgi:8-oxo-dGTP pyrophosphatase MutT (NUDIX family)